MLKMRELQAVEADYATQGPNQFTLVQPIDKSAETLFRLLADGPTWKEWLGIDVEWTSPKPFGVGTTRTVVGSGQTIEETFLVWDEGRRMAFRFDRTTLPMAAFAEDYEIRPTGVGTCELHWHYAFEWGGPLATLAGWTFGEIFKRNGARALARLADYAAGTYQFD